ncbi:hypothetical protein [Paenibacillus roseipurpureus]|uniref:Uncharacterized protein n=1 Tax=Paenibacillus roseopurpureus TaxID=2918901 RepID=A0AA96LQG1_9BACL|nr:hypothetical protein [Paenibacillus sp. MBLB1832]WNR45432.1 hypothetical protein MJB10_04670 [Paenibacillus sp. MBLB1832]
MKSDRLTIMIEKGKKRIITKTPIAGVDRVVFVINHQFTNAPNTTQLASGAGGSSAAGSNAAIKSPHSQQQQSVGAGGKAKNKIVKNAKVGASYGASLSKLRRHGKEIIVVVNDQVVKLPKHAKNASATQVASGAGKYSTSGTNSAIESPGTKQQHAVGGGKGNAANTLVKKRRKK